MKMHTVLVLGFACSLSALLYACSGSDSDTGLGSGASAASSGTGGQAAGAASTGTGGGVDFDAGNSDGSDDACAASVTEATVVSKPIDIIFVIDNSGSMGGEIFQVQNNINVNFAQIIESSNIDYRVIMISEHGEWDGPESICIEAPLSGILQGDCDPPPGQPVHNPPIFYHYSTPILSHDALCNIFEHWAIPDQYNQPAAGQGWSQWLRDDSFKFFVIITDDDASCTWTTYSYNDGNSVAGGTQVAADFDQDIRTLSPLHFGDLTGERNYRVYSIVGMDENTPSTTPWPPTDPIQTTNCTEGGGGSQGPGTGYQGLSVLTEGLRYPSCLNADFDAIFNALAQGVIEGAAVPCEFAMPEAPPGETIDPDTLVVAYTPGGVGSPVELEQVSGAAQCGPDKFYIDNDLITLCPDVCTVVTADEDAKIEILLGCGTPPT